MIIRRRHTANFTTIGNGPWIVPASFPPRVPDLGWTYILSAGEMRSIVKFGCAVDLLQRMERLAKNYGDRGYPIRFECAYAAPWRLNGGAAHKIESLSHMHFAHRRVIGGNDWYLVEVDEAERALIEIIRSVLGPTGELRRFPQRATE